MTSAAVDRPLLVGLVSISDRASAGVYADQGLPGLTAWFEATLTTPHRFETRLVPAQLAHHRCPPVLR